MKNLLNMLKKSDDCISLGRLCALLAFMLFVGVSIYLAYKVQDWGNYEVFSLTCLAYVIVQLGNKAIETKAFKIGGGDKIG